MIQIIYRASTELSQINSGPIMAPDLLRCLYVTRNFLEKGINGQICRFYDMLCVTSLSNSSIADSTYMNKHVLVVRQCTRIQELKVVRFVQRILNSAISDFPYSNPAHSRTWCYLTTTELLTSTLL